MKAQVGKTYLTGIPHNGSTISFQHPAFRGTYGSVAGQIDKEGLQRPTSPETASLVYDAFQNPKGEYESEIVNILRNNWFWEFTGNLYLPKSDDEVNNGVIIEQNPQIVKGKLSMDKQSLVKRLQDGDQSVKFVPFGFKIDEQSVFYLMKNPYIIAKYGEEGAEKIAEVASKYQRISRLWSFNYVDTETPRLSALGGLVVGGGLHVYGDIWYGDGVSRAFGELKEAA